MDNAPIPSTFTFDDVLLIPQYSEILPKEVSLKTRIARNITLNIPFISAAMDTVTEEKMAITMALNGGIGVIHKNCDPEHQAEMVSMVKRFENGLIRQPLVLSPEHKISDVVKIREETGFKSVPITKDGTLQTPVVGMIQRTDYLAPKHESCCVKKRMTPLKECLTASAPLDLNHANDLLEESKYSKLLILDEKGRLWALVTRQDIEKNNRYPNAAKDDHKRLLVAAACGPSANMEERIEGLYKAEVDIFVVDTAHGHSKGVIDTVKYIKSTYNTSTVIAGNIATAEAAEDLIKAGADGLKVGIGPGSICTTRVIAGIGVPQFSAIQNVAKIAQKKEIPLIADGGIKYSGDIAKAIGAGASAAMIGSLLAGTEESPGEIIYSEGRTYKYYRGMGSMAAMTKGGKERYAQANVADEKLVPEGIEGKVLLKGKATAEIFQLCGGIRSAMGYTGSKNIPTFWDRARFVRVTGSGLRESHPHDISILKESPNYRG